MTEENKSFWKQFAVFTLWVIGIAVVLCLGLLCFVVLSDAQQVGPVTVTSAQCASIGADQKSTIYIQVTGTWTGTITPKAALNGQAAAAINVTPAASSTPQASITASGGYYARVAGFTYFQVCGNTVASGTAKVFLNASPAPH